MDEVIVCVNGSQRDDNGEENCIELTAIGQRCSKGGVDYITYPETVVSGLEGTTTVLKLYENQVILLRMGAVEQKLTFRVNESCYGTYITPYGQFKLDVLTRELSIMRERQAGEVRIVYELAIDSQWQSTNVLSIKFWKESCDGH